MHYTYLRTVNNNLLLTKNQKKDMKKMTDAKRLATLIMRGVTNVAVISYPDYCGGRQNLIHFNITDEQVDYICEKMPFTYLEYAGTSTQIALKDYATEFVDHYESQYEKPIDKSYTLWELIELAL